MTAGGISRRGFIGGTAGAGVVLVIGAKASAQQGGGGPYGALAAQADANGLKLPQGFTSRVIALGREVDDAVGVPAALAAVVGGHLGDL